VRVSRLVAGLGVVVVVIAAGAWWALRTAAPARAADAPVFPPLPHRVMVEILNTARIPGASRAAAVTLRHAGLDVVYFGNADSARARDRTQVIVLRGDTTGVGRVVEAVGPADVVVAPDSNREADLSVLLGRSFGARKGSVRSGP
jgi:hypothetical protein